MTQTLIIEFSEVQEEAYWAVNEHLGIDSRNGTGDWPPGLTRHTAGHTDDGGFVVVEDWDTRDAQAAFMETRLGPALGKAGLAPPVRVTWINDLALVSPGT